MDAIKNFWEIILTQRAWSWTLLGITYLLVYLLIRHIFILGIIRRAKTLNSKWFHEIKKVYVKKCIAGWILFIISFLIFVFFWQTANLKAPSLYEIGMGFLILLTILFSIMSHLIALNISSIHVLKQLENNQMTL